MLIGIIGLRGAGKDTFAGFLQELGWVRAAFADALYAEVAQAFGVSVDFLRDRQRKEVPQEELALAKCREAAFVKCLTKYGYTNVPGADALAVPRSPREVLQVWGTEFRRSPEFGGYDSYWLDQVRTLVKSHPETNWVITDVRFTNEYQFVKEMGGTLIRVVRPGQQNAGDPALMHPSERELLDAKVDITIVNKEGALKELRRQAENVHAALTDVLFV